MTRENDAPEERARVRGKITWLVLAYARTYADIEFHAFDLLAFILANGIRVAPGSPCRILRDLRQTGVINYVVTNRGLSLYRFLPLGTRNWRPGDV
jgi:hypothetical protein